MEFVAIYMHGQTIKVSVGTVLDMSSNAEGAENKVSVKVQGIEFVVSLAMLYVKSNIFANGHFFTKALASHTTTGHTTIEITRESAVNDVSLYPICYFFEMAVNS